MKFTNKLKYSLLTATIAFAGFACSDSGSGSGDGQATVNGRVDGDSQKAKSAQTTVVSAAKVTSSGSVETIEGTETETDANGSFQMNVDASTAQNIVVVAESEGKQWMGYAAAEIENGQSYTIKPIDVESSAETKIYSEVVAQGNADLVQKSDIEAAVSSNAAASVQSSATAAGQIATGLKNSAEARAEFYAETMGNEAESSLNQTYELMADAQANLQAELNTASSASEEEAAFEAFFNATADAYVSAGMTEEDAAKSIDSWGRIYVNSLTAVSSDVESDARANASMMAAIAIDNAVQVQAEAAGASESTVQAIAEAGATLKSEVKTSAGTASEIEASFQAYHDEVKTQMENDGSVSATLIVTVDSEINASSGAKSTFESSISGVLNASSVVDIYNSFEAEVKSAVEANGATLTEAQIEAVTELLVLINLSN